MRPSVLALALLGCFDSASSLRPTDRGECDDGRAYETWCTPEGERCEVRGSARTAACGGAECAAAEAFVCRDPSSERECDGEGLALQQAIPAQRKLDLLLVMDNSGSLREAHGRLAEQLPVLMRALVLGSGGAQPLDSVRVGVVSSDMGTGGFDVLCPEPAFGDDGVLLRGSGCGRPDDPFVALEGASESELEAFSNEVACRLNLGTQGCGFEQPLEAMLKALTPSGSSIVFTDGTRGHGDGVNADFVRDDATLAVILLADEDDCSASNPAVYNRDNSVVAPELNDPRLNLRCTSVLYGDDPDVVHPVRRYVDGLVALKEPRDLFFAAIVGVPPDLGPALASTNPDYDLLVGDPAETCTQGCRDARMVERPQSRTSGDPSLLEPSCDFDFGSGRANPPVRIAALARDLADEGARAIVQSICQEDFSPAVSAILRRLGEESNGLCVGRAIGVDRRGAVRCDLLEALPARGDVTRCIELAGRVDTGERTAEGGEICRMCQAAGDFANVVDPDLACAQLDGGAWRYETSGARCSRDAPQVLRFRSDAPPAASAALRVACETPAHCR
ncbi:MAG: hypothetical protein AAF938_22405 [Myxococcota bacterium]